MFTGKERDTESGNDYFGARYYASSMGRFMSPDEFGGHTEDPQTLNRYSYVANNPLSRSDPTGHDFWQTCYQQSATCGSQKIGTDAHGKDINQLVSGATDSNGKFTASVITSASLNDPKSGNSAVVNGFGVVVTTGSGSDNMRRGEGVFISGTASADLKGQGAGWDQFSYHIDGNDVAHGGLTSGTATYLGSGGHQGMVDAISNMTVNGQGPFHYSLDGMNPFHPGTSQYRFSWGENPELQNYGPSPHFPVPPTGTTVPGFHVDNRTGPTHEVCAVTGALCY